MAVLLLDVMDTLVTEPFRESIPRFFGMSLEALIAAKHPTAWIDFEHGRIDEATYFARFFTDGRPVDAAAFKAMLYEDYAWMPGMEALLAELSANAVPMYALSNYSEWYALIDEKLGLSRYLEWRFVSCRTGVRKPDPRAYLGAAAALGLPPEGCLFVDDRASNCAAAEAVGMPAIRFQGAAALRDALAARGLL